MIGEDRSGHDANGLVGNEVREDVAVAEPAAVIALISGGSAFRKIGEGQVVVPFGKLQRVARIDQTVSEYINARVRHHPLLQGSGDAGTGVARSERLAMPLLYRREGPPNLHLYQ